MTIKRFLFLVFSSLLLITCSKDKDEVVAEKLEIPVLKINTEFNSAVNSKTSFTNADINITNNGKTIKEKIKIRGRGNTTWTFPKKPYKFEFDSKIELLGLPAGKEWVLIANYLDGSLMLNSMAFKIGELVQLPYTNHAIPVDVWLNNQYQGSYILTEQIEIKENRIDIGNDGLLLSLDQIIEPTDQSFYSSNYKLPVIIKHPKTLNPSQFTSIKADFEKLEKAILDPNFPNNNYEQLLDTESFAKYFLVYMFTSNEEINHPKSTYIYKTNNGKYTMGPIWDFDWAFSFEERQQYYSNPERPLFWDRKARGEIFFKRIYSDPKIKKLISQKWQQFKVSSYPILIQYLDDYANKIEKSRTEDYKKWRRGNADIAIEKENLKIWFQKRSEYLDKVLL
jgi:hypothetical protein